MSTQKPPHPTAADALPDDRQTVLRIVNGSNSGVMHVSRDCDALCNAKQVEQKDARTLPLSWHDFCEVCAMDLKHD
jgi:hypothetical protein